MLGADIGSHLWPEENVLFPFHMWLSFTWSDAKWLQWRRKWLCWRAPRKTRKVAPLGTCLSRTKYTGIDLFVKTHMQLPTDFSKWIFVGKKSRIWDDLVVSFDIRYSFAVHFSGRPRLSRCPRRHTKLDTAGQKEKKTKSHHVLIKNLLHHRRLSYGKRKVLFLLCRGKIFYRKSRFSKSKLIFNNCDFWFIH